MTPEGLSAELMALRTLQELTPGSVVNVGIGVGLQLAEFATADRGIILHSENGTIGFVKSEDDDPDPDKNILYMPADLIPGAACIDHVASFGLIRNGRVDVTVLGAFEVDEQGRMANWRNPQMPAGGIGGAMELLRHARRVIVVMRHRDGAGRSRLRRTCESPVTGERRVDLVITDLAVLRPAEGGALELIELAPGITLHDVRACTEARLTYSQPVPTMNL